MKALAADFIKAQSEIKSALKESENPGFSRGKNVSKYADLSSVWDACREGLHNNGFGILQPTDFDEKDVWIETILLHKSGESIKGRYPLRPTQQTPQGYGSAVTYARRYALGAMVGVVPDDDDDGNAASAPAPAKPALVANAAPQTQQSNKIAAQGVQEAKDWVLKQSEYLRNNVKTPDDLDLWHDRWGKWLKRLESVVPAEHKSIKDLLDQIEARFQGAAAQ